MKLGMSSDCLDGEIEQGRMTLAEAIDGAAGQGAQCMELVPFAFRFDDPATGKIDTAGYRAGEAGRRADAGVRAAGKLILCLAVSAPRGRGAAGRDRPLEARNRYRRRAGAAAHAPRNARAFRRPQGQNTPRDFERMLPRMAEAARELTQYGRSRGVQTLIENHGFFANGSDRVIRILDLVDDDNYGLLLDTGNVICVDEVQSRHRRAHAGAALPHGAPEGLLHSHP